MHDLVGQDPTEISKISSAQSTNMSMISEELLSPVPTKPLEAADTPDVWYVPNSTVFVLTLTRHRFAACV
jgi:hypothetical protein